MQVISLPLLGIAPMKQTSPICHLNPKWVNFTFLIHSIHTLHEINEDLADIMEITIEDIVINGDWPEC
jgi:hypothetical protein